MGSFSNVDVEHVARRSGHCLFEARHVVSFFPSGERIRSRNGTDEPTEGCQGQSVSARTRMRCVPRRPVQNRVSTLIATTSTNTGVVLIALVGGLFVLIGIGAVAFTLARRKRRPMPCAEQREALALSEKAVQYWEAVRAHVVAVESERFATDSANDPTHDEQLARAVEGLTSAMKQRDQCELDLIRCMASGAPSAPTTPANLQPFFIPGTTDPSPSTE